MLHRFLRSRNSDFGLILGLILCLSSNPTYNYGGEVILGGVDPQLFSGEVLWAPVVQELYWKIGIEA